MNRLHSRLQDLGPHADTGRSGAPDLVPPSFGEFGYAHSVEFRWARGGWNSHGTSASFTLSMWFGSS